ncbi:hypothetical protein D1821_06010 [Phaeobacter inhibens]|uniref:hypothetical protein n=1 Tax=Phaeobacter inhibens TaxID=221822 RepID=UPI000274B516|nr:hypothetical protein [Phaeobacter inhibens]AFO87173.1 hypothetical protein PGA2_c11660 [Phaeobacter inhibens 2.10]AXT41976.1 hypothetical protein D1821_06010 [Phaeobacter inhibens]
MIRTIPNALNKDALFAKSQLYIRKALARKASNELEEYQLWASLSLELLGKSVLASIHPSLIADPQHADSLFAASGVKLSSDIKTITAKTLFLRLQRVIGPFDHKVQEFCSQVANRRNAELHSGDAPFSATQTTKWEAEFWYSMDVILNHMGKTLESWLGADDAATPQAILNNAVQAKMQSIEMRVERTRDSFNQKKKVEREDALRRAAQHKANDYPRLFGVNHDHVWECDCPSCNAKAFMAGEMVEEEVIGTDPDEYCVWETVERYFSGEEFRCPTCGLALDGFDELIFADLNMEFSDTDEREMEYEPDYGND